MIVVAPGLGMKNRVTFIATAIGMLLLIGCSAKTSVAPTSGSASSGGQLVGQVANSITGPIEAVRVAVTSGPSAGASTLTGVDGVFRVSYDFRAAGQLEFAKDGYAPLAFSIPEGRQPNGAIAVALHLAALPLSLRGVYTATFVADASCTQIPEVLRTRSYVATLDQAQAFPQDTRFDVTLTGASFAAGTLRSAVLNSFFGFVEGNTVALTVANLFESVEIAEGIAEQVAPGVLLEIYGKAMVTVDDPAHVSMPMTGYFALTDASGTRICNSSNHRVALTRYADSP
jgi:hypothetical protein